MLPLEAKLLLAHNVDVFGHYELRREHLPLPHRLTLLGYEAAMQQSPINRVSAGVAPFLCSAGPRLNTSLYAASGHCSLFSLIGQRMAAMNNSLLHPRLPLPRRHDSFVYDGQLLEKARLLLRAERSLVQDTTISSPNAAGAVPSLSYRKETAQKTTSNISEKIEAHPAHLESSKSFYRGEASGMDDSIGRNALGEKDRKWLENLELLRRYKEEHGNCIVPRGFPENPRLASWVAEQRKQYKLLKDGKPSFINIHRIQLLNDLGFTWNAQDAAWDRKIAELSRFRREHGHCHVPPHDPKLKQLGMWVKTQRQHYSLWKQGKPSNMTPSRALELEAMGFCWDAHEAQWFDRFRELLEYKLKFGNCNVPAHYEENQRLATWAHHQRRQYKKFKEGRLSHITEERIEMLNTVGFHWNIHLGRTVPMIGTGNGSTVGYSSGKISRSDFEEYESEDALSRPLKRLQTGSRG